MAASSSLSAVSLLKALKRVVYGVDRCSMPHEVNVEVCYSTVDLKCRTVEVGLQWRLGVVHGLDSQHLETNKGPFCTRKCRFRSYSRCAADTE
jgi:hypothetical protein